MKKLIIIFLTTIFNTMLVAQNDLAKNILDQLSLTTKSYKNITIKFNFTFINESQNIKENQNGKLILNNNNFRLEMNDQTIINNGETQWIFLNDLNEVQIMEHDPEDDTMNPNKIFSIYEEDYKYNYIELKSEDEKKIHLIDLFPKKSNEFIKINIAVNADKNQLERIKIYDKNGGNYTYAITSFITNTNIEPFIFNINEFPDIEIIDLR